MHPRSNNVQVQPVVLDTLVWVWAMEGVDLLRSAAVRSAIERASEHGRLYVSAVSLFEVAQWHQRERLLLSLALEDWIQDAVDTPGLTVVQPHDQIAIEASRLPGGFHGDVLDRLIVATTRKLGAALVTADRVLLAYGESGHLPVLDPAVG